MDALLRREARPRGVRRVRRELEAAREGCAARWAAALHGDLAAKVGSDESASSRTIVRINTIESTSPHTIGDSVDEANMPTALIPSEPESPDRAFQRSETEERVRAAIASLPWRERKVVGHTKCSDDEGHRREIGVNSCAYHSCTRAPSSGWRGLGARPTQVGRGSTEALAAFGSSQDVEGAAGHSGARGCGRPATPAWTRMPLAMAAERLARSREAPAAAVVLAAARSRAGSAARGPYHSHHLFPVYRPAGINGQCASGSFTAHRARPGGVLLKFERPADSPTQPAGRSPFCKSRAKYVHLMIPHDALGPFSS
jgi:hypothetical protein